MIKRAEFKFGRITLIIHRISSRGYDWWLEDRVDCQPRINGKCIEGVDEKVNQELSQEVESWYEEKPFTLYGDHTDLRVTSAYRAKNEEG